MSDQHDALLAEAFLNVIAAQGQVNEVQDELFRFSRIVEASDELRDTLSDPHLPAARRQQICEDLLGDKATDTTVALVSLLVGIGRGRSLPAVVGRLLELTAAGGDRHIAEVRSAVELTEDQRSRLAASLKAATGKDVDIVVVVDPSVLGGIVTQIGDTVIDGSVRHRLAQLRESF